MKQGWVIFYDDGTTYSNDDGSPIDAPIKGIVCIAEPRYTLHQHDWYYWHNLHQEWRPADIHGLLHQIVNDRDGNIRSVRQGTITTDWFYQSCIAKAFKARTT